MNHLQTDGYEKQKDTPEQIEVIGREMPNLEEIYDDLSTEPTIRVFTEAQGLRKGTARRDVSEKEVVDNLLDFCGKFRELSVDGLDERERELHGSVANFIESIHFMTHREYEEAINGLALRHAQWLGDDDTRRLALAVQGNRQHNSQRQVASDIYESIVSADPTVNERVDVSLIGDMANNLTESTKIVIADDWSVSGNLIAQDMAHVCQMLNRTNRKLPVEVNLLVARQDQIDEGVTSLDRVLEFYGQPMPEKPAVVAYFAAPGVESVYGYKAVPSGSHSSVDYGFSETLEVMRQAMDRQARGGAEVYMPYAGAIIPTYAYNYDEHQA